MAQQKQQSKKEAGGQTAVKSAAVKGSAVKHTQAEQSAREERHRMIAEAAYFISEGRGFQGNMALDDWLRAEAEVDAQFAARH